MYSHTKKKISLSQQLCSPRFLVIFIFGISSGLPLMLLTSTLQAWFASTGQSILFTGMISLVGLPYLFRSLWSPWIDRIAGPLGRRRSWILAMQLLLGVGFVLMSFFQPQVASYQMIMLACILALFSATQDAAIDAHRTEYLSSTQFGLGASLATLGYRLAVLVSGGLALMLADFLGWHQTYLLMAAAFIPMLFTTFISEEPDRVACFSAECSEEESPYIQTYLMPFKTLWQQSGIILLLAFIFFYKLGEAFTSSTSGIVIPFLVQGLHFSLINIGLIHKIGGLICTIIGGLCAGIILLRVTLYRALLIFGCCQIIANGFFVALALVGKNILLLIIAVCLDNFATGLCTTALVVLLMRRADKRFTATHLSLLIAFASLPRVLSGPLGAFIQSLWDWSGVYLIGLLFSLLFIPFLLKLKETLV